jgi:hypothetical protein
MNKSDNDILTYFRDIGIDFPLLWLNNQLESVLATYNISLDDINCLRDERLWCITFDRSQCNIKLEPHDAKVYDIFQVSTNQQFWHFLIKYSIYCNTQEKFLYIDDIRLLEQKKWHWLRVMITMVSMAKKLWCHCIYAACLWLERSTPPLNGANSFAVFWFDFDHDDEFINKYDGYTSTNFIKKQSVWSAIECATFSLYDLLSDASWRETWYDYWYSFNWKFDLLDGSKSIQRLKAYALGKWIDPNYLDF